MPLTIAKKITAKSEYACIAVLELAANYGSGEPLTILPTDEESLGIARINLALTADWEQWRQRLDVLWNG